MSQSTFSWKNIEGKLSRKEKYPFIANSYVVSFGSVVASFSKISGISLKMTEYMAMNEGGSDAPYILLDQSKNFNTITFEKGLGMGIDFQETKTTDMLQLIEKMRIRDMLLIIYGNTPKEKKAYYTDTAYVKDIVLSDLNATSQEVLIQSMTIVYDVFKESQDSSNSGSKTVSTTSNVGITSNKNQKKSSNTTTLKKSKENEEITKASVQNNNVNEKEKIKLEEERKKEELEKQKKESVCF